MKGISIIVIIIFGFVLGLFTAHVFGEHADKKQQQLLSKEASNDIKCIQKKCNPQFVKSVALSTTEVPLTIPITGKITFNPKFSKMVSVRVAGRINRILVFEGSPVKSGEALVEVYAPDYISAQQEYLLASRTLEAIKNTHDRGLIADGKATLKAAAERLINLGAWQQDITHLKESGHVAQFQLIRAPIDGLILKRNFEQGAYINIGDNIMSIVTPGKLWFLVNIYEQDYSKVKLGQTLLLRSAALPDKKFSCVLDYIGAGIDPVTHVLPASCTIFDSTHDLRPELYMKGELIIGKQRGFKVPVSAIVSNKDQSYVILDKGNNVYQRQQVTAIRLSDQEIAILSGLNDNEKVVMNGALLINELLVNS